VWGTGGGGRRETWHSSSRHGEIGGMGLRRPSSSSSPGSGGGVVPRRGRERHEHGGGGRWRRVRAPGGTGTGTRTGTGEGTSATVRHHRRRQRSSSTSTSSSVPRESAGAGNARGHAHPHGPEVGHARRAAGGQRRIRVVRPERTLEGSVDEEIVCLRAGGMAKEARRRRRHGSGNSDPPGGGSGNGHRGGAGDIHPAGGGRRHCDGHGCSVPILAVDIGIGGTVPGGSRVRPRTVVLLPPLEAVAAAPVRGRAVRQRRRGGRPARRGHGGEARVPLRRRRRGAVDDAVLIPTAVALLRRRSRPREALGGRPRLEGEPPPRFQR